MKPKGSSQLPKMPINQYHTSELVKSISHVMWVPVTMAWHIRIS